MNEQEKYEALEELLDSIQGKQSIPFKVVEDFISDTGGKIITEDILDFLSANDVTVIGFQKDEPTRNVRKDDPLWLYIKEVGKVKILGKERELKVAKRMEDALHEIRGYISLSTLTLRRLVEIGVRLETREIALDTFVKATSGDPQASMEEKRNDILEIILGIYNKLEELRKAIREKRKADGKNQKIAEKEIASLWSEIKSKLEMVELTARGIEMFSEEFKKIERYISDYTDRFDAAAHVADIETDLLREKADSVISGDVKKDEIADELKIAGTLLGEAIILRRREKRIHKCLEEMIAIPVDEFREKLKSLSIHWNEYEECKRLLIEANVRLVINIAKNYTNQGVEFLDLIQEGNAALIKAVERFDPSRGYKLGTYAIWWIRQAMLRTLAEQSQVVKLPTYLVQWVRRYARVAQELSQKYGREPTPQEVSDAMNVEPSKSRKMRRFFTGQVSLNKTLGDDDNRTLEDVIADESGDSPMNMANLTMLQTELRRILETLTPKEQKVISLRFGLEDNYPRTLEEIGQIFDLSRERIRQIEMKALSKLRHQSKLDKLLPYLQEY